jgi:hypothetical protein
MRRWRDYAICAAAFLALSHAALAARRPEAEQKKIDALIEDVRQSNAIFIRNGVEYEAVKAVSHLKFKLFMAGSRVQTVRDFVEGVASHSEETKKPYLIRPAGSAAAVPLRDWLLRRLAEHEKAPSGGVSSRSPAPATPKRSL